jgi:hypothetical protein
MVLENFAKKKEDDPAVIRKLASKFYEDFIKHSDTILSTGAIIEACSTWLSNALYNLCKEEAKENNMVRYLLESHGGKRTAEMIEQTPGRQQSGEPETEADKIINTIKERFTQKKARTAEMAYHLDIENEYFLEALLWKQRTENRLEDTGMQCYQCKEIVKLDTSTIQATGSGPTTLSCNCGSTKTTFTKFEHFNIPEELKIKYKEAHLASIKALERKGIPLHEVDKSNYRKQQVQIAFEKVRSDGKVTWTSPEVLYQDGVELFSKEGERQAAEQTLGAEQAERQRLAEIEEKRIIALQEAQDKQKAEKEKEEKEKEEKLAELAKRERAKEDAQKRNDAREAGLKETQEKIAIQEKQKAQAAKDALERKSQPWRKQSTDLKRILKACREEKLEKPRFWKRPERNGKRNMKCMSLRSQPSSE